MGEPVDAIVGEKFALVGAVGVHHPDLRVTVAVAVVVDLAAIGGIVGAITVPLAPGQLHFHTAQRHGADVDHPVRAPGSRIDHALAMYYLLL